MRQRTIYNVSLITIALSLSSSTAAISFEKDIDIRSEKIDTNLKLSLPSSEVSNLRDHTSLLEIASHLTFQDEQISDAPKMNAHIFQQAHQRRRLRKKIVKRSPALEGLVNGAREFGEAAQGSKAAETASDINKARELSSTSSSADITKLGRADSFRGATSRLDTVPALSRAKSLPSTLSGVTDQKAALKAMDLRFDKSLYEITDDIFKNPEPIKEGEEEEIEYDEFEKVYQQTKRRPVALEAFFSLYAEKELFQTIIDGKADIQTVNAMANLLDVRRGAYVDALKTAMQEGVSDKTFLNYRTVETTHAQVVSLRKLISAPEIDLSQLKTANDLGKGKRVSFPESLGADELRGKNSDVLFQRPLMDITADEYFNALYKEKSSIDIPPAEDTSVEKVKTLANEAMEADDEFEKEKTVQNYKVTREARKYYQYYLQSYIAKNEAINYSLFTDLQEIFNRKGIPLSLKTPPKSKVLVWYDRFKSQYQAVMYRLSSVFKGGSDSKITPIFPAEDIDALSIV